MRFDLESPICLRLQVAAAVSQAVAVALWAAAYSYRVWQHSHDGHQWPDAETDLANGWSAWDHTGRRCSATGKNEEELGGN